MSDHAEHSDPSAPRYGAGEPSRHTPHHTPHRFAPPRDLDALDPEARALVAEARACLEGWIDENVDRLEAASRSDVEARRAELARAVAGIEEELAGTRERIAGILGRLDALEDAFVSGDGMTVEDAVRATRAVLHAARESIEERERGLRRLAARSGTGVLAAASSA